ncbi:MAG: EscU/YscU/HrcU family type III secretion system export apparatus switch protein [SAR324 cluster bacterium]|uniref:EscU/YscU/HrcU family type III secretion system export apparatus switch protein n=1 Tax=SAR324 cluster bacterium TaxID=2024889 RepID=A0A7X9FRV6_9DELT|nr:EscU/YscU/HrcU family type III secretion system export apparatus switch protein [SAR324 cluster bacterium]
MSDEKPFEPSPRKLREARKKGQVFRSPLLNTAILFCFLSIILIFSINISWLRFKILLEYLLIKGFTNPALSFRESAILILELLFPTLLALGLAGFILEITQVGTGWSPMAGAGLKVSEGTKRIVNGFARIHHVALKATCLMFLLIYLVWENFPSAQFISLDSQSVVLAACQKLLIAIWAPICAALLLMGVIEFVFKRKKFLSDLSMSLEELRQELREDEGDPHIKAARQQIARSMAYDELVSQVRTSRVLVVERA